MERTKTLPEWRQALPQVIAVSVKNTVLLSYGLTLGFTTILIPALSEDNPSEKIHFGQEALSWIGSINYICVPLGALISGYITQSIGRKMTMQLVNIPILVAWLLYYFSTEAWHIFLASCFTGLAGGVLEAPVLTYVAEVTQPQWRGILSSTSTASIVLGLLIQFLLGTFYSWRTVALINCVFPVTSITSLMLIPETPAWLVTKNRLEEARRSLAWLRGWTGIESIENEFQELNKEIEIGKKIDEENTMTGLGRIRLFGKRNFTRPYLLIMFAFFLCHFNGNTTLQAYAIKVFKVFQAPLNEYHSTVLMGLVQLLGCILSACLINYLGKRITNFISVFGTAICFIVVGTYAYMNEIKYLNGQRMSNENVDSDPYSWISLTFLVMSTFLSYFGIKILPWVLTGELFCHEMRATASGISGGTGYIIGFLANKFFLDMVSSFTLPGVFWFYGCVGILGTVLLYFTLPETEGKTLFEITEHFSGRNKLTNKVRRKRKLSGQCNAAFEVESQNATVESRL
ncbi:hypothetical protein JTB14_028116 [Gonioctena quinquepunctata]|nr:hypothetical protein JTB14_028116 [Gonioctena quinquepunctata]